MNKAPAASAKTAEKKSAAPSNAEKKSATPSSDSSAKVLGMLESFLEAAPVLADTIPDAVVDIGLPALRAVIIHAVADDRTPAQIVTEAKMLEHYILTGRHFDETENAEPTQDARDAIKGLLSVMQGGRPSNPADGGRWDAAVAAAEHAIGS